MERFEIVPEQPVAERIGHSDADMAPQCLRVVSDPFDFRGKGCDLMSQPQNFAAFRRQLDRVMDPVKQGKLHRIFQLTDLKRYG